MLLIIIALLLLDVVYNNKAIRAIITEVQELVSAHKRSTLLEELKVLIKQIEEEGSSYTEKKWEEVNEEFSELLQKLNSYEDLSAGLTGDDENGEQAEEQDE